MIEFLWLWAFLLIPIPWLLRRFLKPVTQLQQSALRVPSLEDFNQHSMAQGQHTASNNWMLITAALIWILLSIAAARPQWVGDPIELPVSGRDLMLAVDLSGSMQEKDFVVKNQAIDRLTATKVVASDFIERRTGDRLGLILFGDRAYVQTPLTFDRTTVRTLLLESAIGLAGERTAIGDAIGIAIKRLQNNAENDRVLVLITDGANTAGEIQPLKAAELAANSGLKIYTIGIGADEIVKRSFFGVVRRSNPSSDLDEATLRKVAETTGGRYFRAHNTEELAQIYTLLDQLEPVERETRSFRPTQALFYWPLGIATVLAMLLLLTKLIRKQL